ncbi:RagB/SusD family nutrient uptake outer membrane protein [Prevotella cerevisiae]|uniref:RagB/SusD family nutrient uptake outer membrane protein n=1 Tax=Segatella cerevisiae TaxID=2053716 RepID=A0ABT1BZI3_9BACT|nr:RagB/SusD family nutrient uptake outer membrane protein [Segatella cerevisiae]MCO6026498.1 RagB/SusD family nutrient uptake outer membrane protein [Segatella cerevisiae]
MKNIIKEGALCILAIAGFTIPTGCSSDFLDTVPTGEVSSASVWKSENLATKALNGVYERLYYEDRADPGHTLWDAYTEVMDEDVNWVSGNAPILLGSATASSGGFSQWWQCFYEGISRANDVIANVDKVPDMPDAEKSRYQSECKFIRAYEYYRLNVLYRGVPIYTEPVAPDKCTKGRSTENEVWQQVISDCSDVISDPNVPDKHSVGDPNWGHITKGAAYMLRAKTYMWLKDYAKAEADFKTITTLGYSLFPNYKTLFKEANEKNDEFIFVYQYSEDTDCGQFFSWTYGNRNSRGYSWNNYIPNPAFVDSYECANGKAFNIDDILPGYSSMTPKQRIVFYLRDGLTDAEKTIEQNVGVDMSKYLNSGNEARIKMVYENRDPRMTENFITPYSTYLGGCTGTDISYTLRWPYRGYDDAAPYDLRTDTNDRFYYLWRKWVAEGTSEIVNQDTGPTDIPIFRYAEALLGLAEALNEEGKTDEAIKYVNMVRARAGVAPLNSNEYTKVTGQDDLRQRIRNEYAWELAGENHMYFEELRWDTWHQQKFVNGNGMTEIWGSKKYTNTYMGDYSKIWPIPQAEIERNSNLKQNPGWY